MAYEYYTQKQNNASNKRSVYTNPYMTHFTGSKSRTQGVPKETPCVIVCH